jgi:hypothetical protein
MLETAFHAEIPGARRSSHAFAASDAPNAIAAHASNQDSVVTSDA